MQAKSGTGKTCVLAVLALEALVSAPPAGRCRALVLAPTREVAVQVAQVISAIGVEVPGKSAGRTVVKSVEMFCISWPNVICSLCARLQICTLIVTFAYVSDRKDTPRRITGIIPQQRAHVAWLGP